jgi:membrane protein YqaA with SNARE-associated domain
VNRKDTPAHVRDRSGAPAPQTRRPWDREPAAGAEETAAGRRRRIIVGAEIALVLSLLLVWLFADGVQESRNLWILFLYSFPSEFLVGLLPHEPILIYFGEVHPAWVVATVAAASTAMTEAMNYSLFGYFYDRPAIRSASAHPAVVKTTRWFDRAPFAAIVVAGFTPVPFFPVRFLVVMTGYPRWKYVLGVLLSRTPRFYLLAFFGAVLHIPVEALAGLFLVLLLSVNVPALVQLMRSGGG